MSVTFDPRKFIVVQKFKMLNLNYQEWDKETDREMFSPGLHFLFLSIRRG